jgi:hypothetical protein
MLPHQNVINL